MTGDARRVQIREVAADLFDRSGYRDTSMDKIAEEVGIKKASLYYYFPSKDRLLIEMHDEMIELIIASHEARRDAGDPTASQLLLGMMTDIISLQETHPGSLRVFFEHFKEIPEPERTRVMARRAVYEQYLREQLPARHGRWRVQAARHPVRHLRDPRHGELVVSVVPAWRQRHCRTGRPGLLEHAERAASRLLDRDRVHR